MRTVLPALLCVAAIGPVFGGANAWETTDIQVTARETLSGRQAYRRAPPPDATHRLELTLVYFAGGAWSRDAVVGAARDAAEILEQCRVRVARMELVRVEAPPRYRYLDTPVSRKLAGTLRLARPTVYFVTDTRHAPAFDAEAIGRGNSGTRPELADSVWVTRAAADVGIALAHELVHVLSDSGAHVDSPGNLMRDETAPANTRLTDGQCARLRDIGAQNGLLARE